MIRLDEKVPSVYVNESRDFQFISRLYTLLENSVKGDIDILKGIYSPFEVSAKLLPLLANFMGFYPNIDIDDRAMRYVLNNFPLMIKNKGNINGIKLAVETILQIDNVRNAKLDITVSDFVCLISIHQTSIGKITNLVLLNELLKYVLPVGVEHRVSIYKNWDNKDSAEILTFDTSTITPIKMQYDNSKIRSSTFKSIVNPYLTDYSGVSFKYGTPVINGGIINKSQGDNKNGE